MTLTWAQRREELLGDCIVSPDVFQHMVDCLGDFVLPYQHALETEAGKRNVHLYLQGLLSHVPRKNVEPSQHGAMWSDRSCKTSSVSHHGTTSRW